MQVNKYEFKVFLEGLEIPNVLKIGIEEVDNNIPSATIYLAATEKTLNIKDKTVVQIYTNEGIKNNELKLIFEILENNIYSGENIKIDKKRLKEIIKKYNLS